ncbi:MAG: rhodanese-like domain-containing protein [Chloroflexota bacterium]|nr:rhodanese-like domain-containing protein [Chloroflexota bacterium]
MSFRLFNDEDEQEPFDRIDAAHAQQMVDSGQARLIDVREPDEWEEGHAPQAEHVPLQTFLSAPSSHVQPEDSVVFICRSGQRSAVAAEMAAAVGVRKAYNLEGGILDWQERGYPVES